MVKEIQQQFLSLGVNEDNGSDDEPIDEDLPQGHYEVEAIVGHRGPKHRREYLVRWVGYDESSNSWLSPNNFDDSDIIIEYEKDVRRRRKK
jgi:hypothetical protein